MTTARCSRQGLRLDRALLISASSRRRRRAAKGSRIGDPAAWLRSRLFGIEGGLGSKSKLAISLKTGKWASFSAISTRLWSFLAISRSPGALASRAQIGLRGRFIEQVVELVADAVSCNRVSMASRGSNIGTIFLVRAIRSSPRSFFYSVSGRSKSTPVGGRAPRPRLAARRDQPFAPATPANGWDR